MASTHPAISQHLILLGKHSNRGQSAFRRYRASTDLYSVNISWGSGNIRSVLGQHWLVFRNHKMAIKKNSASTGPAFIEIQPTLVSTQPAFSRNSSNINGTGSEFIQNVASIQRAFATILPVVGRLANFVPVLSYHWPVPIQYSAWTWQHWLNTVTHQPAFSCHPVWILMVGLHNKHFPVLSTIQPELWAFSHHLPLTNIPPVTHQHWWPSH